MTALRMALLGSQAGHNAATLMPTVANGNSNKPGGKCIMTAFSGSYIARTHSQSVVTVPDVPDHAVALTAVSGEQKCTDPLWNGATVAFWGTTDTIAGQ